MDWSAQVDGYCERLGPGLWAEPVNALTNLAFLLGAILAWHAAREAGGWALAALLGVIGVASGLFHTTATIAAGAFDSLSILAFALLYLWLAVRDFLEFQGRQHWAVFGGLVLFMVVSVAVVASRIPLLGENIVYIAIWALILGWGLGLRSMGMQAGRGLLLASAVLAVSILMRMLDGVACGHLPIGTHSLWHLLNAWTLWWMIEVRRRHLLEETGAGR